MSEIISTSVSAAAIFCSEDILGWPPKRKDIVMVDGALGVGTGFRAGGYQYLRSFDMKRVGIVDPMNTYRVVELVGVDRDD